MTHATRESWLNALADAMRPVFHAKHMDVPTKLRVTCGWPSQGATSTKKQRIGECWHAASSKDGHSEVFISPVLDDALRVADVLAHELVHAALGSGHGHNKKFARAAVSIGLEGKPTATIAGPDFLAWCKPLMEAIGAYPHSRLNLSAARDKKADKNRQLKVKCAECGYTARTTKKWLEKSGAPLCPCNHEEMEAELVLEEEEVEDAA